MADKQAKLAAALRKRPSDDDVTPPLDPTRGPEEVKLRKSNLQGTTSWEQCLALLELNLKHEYAVCVETVTKMLTNITSNPSEPKFRKIRVPTSSRILSHRRRGHERRRVPSAAAGGGRSTPCAAPSVATDAFADEPFRSPWTRRVSRKGRRASLPAPPPAHRAHRARARASLRLANPTFQDLE